MKKIHFPYLAALVGLILVPIIVLGNSIGEDGLRAVPLLSLLVMNEFGFFAAAFGIFIGVKQLKVIGFQPLYGGATLLCGLLLLTFMWLATTLWPL